MRGERFRSRLHHINRPHAEHEFHDFSSIKQRAHIGFQVTQANGRVDVARVDGGEDDRGHVVIVDLIWRARQLQAFGSNHHCHSRPEKGI